MIDDMNMRRLSPKTQVGYIPAVTKLATYLKHSPAHATAEELRQFQIAMADIQHHHQRHVIWFTISVLQNPQSSRCRQ
jgi:hypothetical protein